MLYQLSYLGAGPLPIPHAMEPIKPTRPAAPPPNHLASQVSDTVRLASARDRLPRTGGCRTAAIHPLRTCRRSDMTGQIVWAQPCCVSSVHPVAGRAGSDRTIKARPARRARSGRASASPCNAATIAGRRTQHRHMLWLRRDLCRNPTQRRQPRGMWTGEQLVQWRMHTAPYDFGGTERGEAEQPRPQRVVSQRGVQARREHASPRGRQPGKVDQIAPDRLRSRISRASPGSTARFAARCETALPCRPAIAPPASTLIATKAGVG